MNLASLRLDAGLIELCVSVISHGSKVNLASELQHLIIFRLLTVVLSFLQCDTPPILCPKSIISDI